MLGPVEMLGGMFVLRRIAAAYVPAGHAKAKMHPPIAHLQALFTAFRVRLYVLDLTYMFTFTHFRHSFQDVMQHSWLWILLIGRQSIMHDLLGLAQDGAQVRLALEAFRVDLVQVLSPGGPRGEPPAGGYNL
jgi:hypothetical protein